jgi:hypothetical protein
LDAIAPLPPPRYYCNQPTPSCLLPIPILLIHHESGSTGAGSREQTRPPRLPWASQLLSGNPPQLQANTFPCALQRPDNATPETTRRCLHSATTIHARRPPSLGCQTDDTSKPQSLRQCRRNTQECASGRCRCWNTEEEARADTAPRLPARTTVSPACGP